MRNIGLCALLLVASTAANAGGSAAVMCGIDHVPVLSVTYLPAGDAGIPGLIYLGVLSPDRQSGAVMTENGWVNYAGGLFPYMARFNNGLPGSITRTYSFPAGSTSTAPFVGYGVYMGHGAYTTASQTQVQDRRAALSLAKPALVAAGAWNAEYETDDRLIWALVQKDMVDNTKNSAILTIPLLDCAPGNPI